jgi:hypothetical protein
VNSACLLRLICHWECNVRGRTAPATCPRYLTARSVFPDLGKQTGLGRGGWWLPAPAPHTWGVQVGLFVIVGSRLLSSVRGSKAVKVWPPDGPPSPAAAQ